MRRNAFWRRDKSHYLPFANVDRTFRGLGQRKLSC
nr:MAG TPA: hypothetical protein [Caudoviricetes sp.]